MNPTITKSETVLTKSEAMDKIYAALKTSIAHGKPMHDFGMQVMFCFINVHIDGFDCPCAPPSPVDSLIETALKTRPAMLISALENYSSYLPEPEQQILASIGRLYSSTFEQSLSDWYVTNREASVVYKAAVEAATKVEGRIGKKLQKALDYISYYFA